MAPTTRSRAPRAEANHTAQQLDKEAPIQQSDDDDAPPEEVTLASSRKQANEERQAQQQAAKSAYKTRRSQNSKAAPEIEDQTEDPEQGASRKRTRQDTAEEGHGQELEEQRNDDDLLPEDVLNAIESLDDHRSEAERQGYAKSMLGADDKQAQAMDGRKRRKQSHVVKRGPLMVATMKAVQKQAAGTASSFLKDHLHGARLKRSAAMLHPVAARRLPGGIVGPAVKFV